jgi:hypothetical protein
MLNNDDLNSSFNSQKELGNALKKNLKADGILEEDA